MYVRTNVFDRLDLQGCERGLSLFGICGLGWGQGDLQQRRPETRKGPTPRSLRARVPLSSLVSPTLRSAAPLSATLSATQNPLPRIVTDHSHTFQHHHIKMIVSDRIPLNVVGKDRKSVCRQRMEFLDALQSGGKVACTGRQGTHPGRPSMPPIRRLRLGWQKCL
jgi:hypothetical protein